MQLAFPETQARSGEGQLRPRARLLRTIGAELISSEVVAVIELVRNCFDADAGEVEIRFRDSHDLTRASLEIRDDGHGMDLEALLGPWLEPATSHKIGDGKGFSGSTSPSGRRRLGSKGVGRFATQRLGDHLALHTKTTTSTRELRADFDWSSLDEGERYLDQLRIPWREDVPRELPLHGTLLRVTRLRDIWSADRFERLRVGLARLVSPIRAPGDAFRIWLDVDGTREEIRPSIDTIRPMYAVEGTIAEGGKCDLVYTDLTGTRETWERTVFWPQEGITVGPFRMRLHAWDLDREPLRLFLAQTHSPLGLREFRRVVRDHSGISLYRDSFRVLPYGEPDNDWLRLDRRRVNNPTLRFSNNQISGWLSLGADTNPHLADQTNREGLVTNDAYTHLQRVVLDVLGLFETRRFAARRTLDVLSQKPRGPGGSGRVRDELDAILDNADEGSVDTRAIRRGLEVRMERERDAAAHMTSLAAVGQLARGLMEQLESPLRGIERDMVLVREDLRAGLSEDEQADLAEHVERLRSRLGQVVGHIAGLRPLSSTATRPGQRAPVVPHDLVQRTLSAFEGRIANLGIKVFVRGPNSPVSVAEFAVSQTLAALVDNALDELAAAPAGGRRLTVYCRPESIEVCDSGKGVPEELADMVFDPWFTTKEGHEGLGLTIARDHMRAAGGDLAIRPPKKGGNEMRIVFTRPN